MSYCRAEGIRAVAHAMPLTAHRLGGASAVALAHRLSQKAGPASQSSVQAAGTTGQRLLGYKQSIDEVSAALQGTNSTGKLLIQDVIGKVRAGRHAHGCMGGF